MHCKLQRRARNPEQSCRQQYNVNLAEFILKSLEAFGGCGFLLEKVDPLRLNLRRVDCWQVALTARTFEPLHLLE